VEDWRSHALVVTALLRRSNRVGTAAEPGGADVASRRDAIHRFVAPAYITAGIFLITAALDIATLAYPANPSAIVWRFGTVGAISNYLMTGFFGLTMACATAMYYRHLAMLRVLSVLSLAGAVMLLVILGDFGLNVAQIHRTVPPAQMNAFQIGTAKATIKYGMTIVALLVLAIVCWKASRRRA
jgi:hypothetical protein